ncbi:unnamed protein product, partial [Closterium sp. NIES-54]
DHSLSAPPSDESVELSGLNPELVGCLIYLMTCTQPDLAYLLSLLARYVAPGRHRMVHWDAAKSVLRYLCSTPGMGLVLGGRGPVVLTTHADASWVDNSATHQSSLDYTFSLGSGSVSWQSTRSSPVLSSSCEAEIYAGAMAAQELRWLTYLLTVLGEQPRSPPVLYVDNKAMIALCQEHILEHKTKHIALRFFLARELQQRGQLRLAYVATRANTAHIFTKELPPGFTPSTADPSLFLRTDTSLPPFYVLVYVDDLVFATADTEAVTLVLQRFGFQFSSPQPTPLSTGHSLSAPPSDESVELSGPYPELVGCLMHLKVHWDDSKRVLCYLCSTSGMGLVFGGWGPVVLTGHAGASWVDDSATQRLSQGYTFRLGSGFVSWRSPRLSSVLSSCCEAEIYTGAMAAQELCWLTCLLTDLGEQPRSPPVLYVDNKAMIVLCHEYRLEHRTKHITL